MKKVISVSLGSSRGDHQVFAKFLGEEVYIARIGMDGDVEKMKRLLVALDMADSEGVPDEFCHLVDGEGQPFVLLKPDALGLGGTTIYLWQGKVFQEGLRMRNLLENTPLLDGYYLKISLERYVIEELGRMGYLDNKKILLTSAVDREGMAYAFRQMSKERKNMEVIFGDLMYLLGINIPVRRLSAVNILANTLTPILSRLPVSVFYPMGEKQTDRVPKYVKIQEWADIIAGDSHQLLKHLPERGMEGKMVITNTTTSHDIRELKAKGIGTLVTTTPPFKGRSFGTNVMEALLVAFGAEIGNVASYYELIKKAGWGPNIEVLNT